MGEARAGADPLGPIGPDISIGAVAGATVSPRDFRIATHGAGTDIRRTPQGAIAGLGRTPGDKSATTSGSRCPVQRRHSPRGFSENRAAVGYSPDALRGLPLHFAAKPDDAAVVFQRAAGVASGQIALARREALSRLAHTPSPDRTGNPARHRPSALRCVRSGRGCRCRPDRPRGRARRRSGCRRVR